MNKKKRRNKHTTLVSHLCFSFLHPFITSCVCRGCLNGFWKRKHPGGGEGAGQRKRGTEGSSWLFFFFFWWDGEKGGRMSSVEGAINAGAAPGHRGAEVLQRSWELLFKSVEDSAWLLDAWFEDDLKTRSVTCEWTALKWHSCAL